ncbi:hypothetical protein MNBD_GAMMA02-869 [hydrothermal vent metagenome]|uniref:TonB C-terminal domain-containing protein n=1 Tax=hydrothermal vent metagenome TaxID=652676 RepID=A0A3B0WG85_9ZZZZ
MKNIFILLVCLISQLAYADFNDASDAYANKKYQQAFNEFNRLAQLGNKRAQFNLGVMYLNGEFVEQDFFKAYAWGKLSEHSERPEFSQIRETLEKELTEEGLDKAGSTFKAIKEAYGDEQIYATLSPIVYQASDDKSENKTEYKLNVITRRAPRYPKEAYYDRIQGWATAGFEVHPDGTVRNPYIIDSYPENTFEKETLKAVQKFKFEVQFEPQVEPFVVQTRQTIQYSLERLANPDKLRRYYDKRLQQLRELADQGSAQAQYLYAIAASSLLINKDNIMSQEEVNQWLLKSAQNGHVEAQYHLGKNILRGKGCKIEKQKGIDWIVYAAEQGHPRSSRTAYSLLTKHNNLNNTDKAAEYWLKQAAENGDADSQLDYAEFLTNQENADLDNLILARKFLEKQAGLRDKSVKWYQVSASIYRQQGEAKKAEKHQKKANKMANKLGWSI